MATDARPREWIDRTAAARLLGCDPRAVERMAGRGLIGTRDLPGTRQRYRAADVEALAGRCVRPATAAEPASA